LTSANRLPTRCHTHHLPGTVDTGIHPWGAHFSSVTVVIEGEHWSRLRRGTSVRSRSRRGRRAHRWASPWRFLTVCAKFLRLYGCVLWLCKPTVSSAVRGAGFRWSRRWRSRMWRSWAHGLLLWGWLDVLLNSLKWRWRRLMVEKWTFNDLATALVDIPAVSVPIARSLNLKLLWCCVAHFSGLLSLLLLFYSCALIIYCSILVLYLLQFIWVNTFLSALLVKGLSG
jgi:hypothetical protein